MHLKEFLARVLPPDGYKCWVEINCDKKVTQGFVPTTEELAVKLLEIDARGSDAYFACATYQTPKNRRAPNALAAGAFWMDIDVGEGKPYATAESALEVCDQFAVRCGLELPGVVRSGTGLHAYWVLDTPLAAAAWRSVAQRFKLLAEAAGFHADPARTADIASLLRPPGTKNYKLSNKAASAGRHAPPSSVEIDDPELFAPVSCTNFIEAVLKNTCGRAPETVKNTSEKPPGHHPPAASPPVLPERGGLSPATNASLLAGISKAFDATKGVAQGCRGSTQLRYAGELVAKGYGEKEVTDRCLAWNQLCTPPQDEKEVRRIVRSAFTMHAQKRPAALPPQEVHTLPRLPYGYEWGPQQQLLVETLELDASGAEVKRKRVVSPYPVYLAAILNHEHGGRDNSYLFRQYSVIDGWNEFCISSEGVNSTNWYAAWYKNGGSINSGMDKYFKTYIREAEVMLRASGEITRYNQFGWKEDDSFLVGDVLLKDGQPARAYGTEKLTPLMRTMAVPKEGSLEEWTTAADKFFAPGMEAHGFALLCSFAAPLMKFCAGLGDGGSILSLHSEDSGKGKTPVSEAIASVWGDLDSTVVTGNFTENRRIEAIVRHCNLPQVQEEMTLSDPLIAAESVKKFTTGCDRGRLDRSGAASGVPERYQTILVSISNTSLYDMVALVDRAAGWRIFEITMKRPNSEVFSNLGGITREMMRNRAHAGRRFAQIITSPHLPQYLREHLTGLAQDKPGSAVMRYRHLLETQAEHRFIVWLLACVDVAARLVTHYGLLHFDVERIMQWAVTQAEERVGIRSPDDAPAKLNRFLSEHVSACLVVSGPMEPSKGPVILHRAPKDKLFMRMEVKTSRLYIANEPLRHWCVRNRVSFVTLGRTLAENGVVIERSRPVTLGSGTDIPSSRCYCWEVDLTHAAMGGMLKNIVAGAPAAATV